MINDNCRHLIVNADDFGLSEGTNRGIIRAFEQGIVTSVSLMVRFPAAQQAAAYCREHPQLSVGLHFDIGEWTYRDGEWVRAYQVVDAEDPFQIEAELTRQLELFCELVRDNPTHLDSHQHVHRDILVQPIVLSAAAQLGIPLRESSSGIHYDGSFYGQTSHGEALHEGICVEALLQILSNLPSGISELACHPGLDPQLDSVYCHERTIEVNTLCDARIKGAVKSNGIGLLSFREAQPRVTAERSFA